MKLSPNLPTEVFVTVFALSSMNCAAENVSAEVAAESEETAVADLDPPDTIRADDVGAYAPAADSALREFRTLEREPIVEAKDDPSCTKKLPQNLRELFYEHFRHAIDTKGSANVGEAEVARFAKVIGMAPRESGGATVALTDMKLNGSKASSRLHYQMENPGRRAPQAMFSSVAGISYLYEQKNVKWDRQTNFGLLQMSADRMATRYRNSDQIAKSEMEKIRALYRSHPEDAIARCGTRRMFRNSESELRAGFDTMVACEPGYTTKEKVQCFGRWAMLCPNYNVTLALIAPPAYFATRKAPALCAKTFRKILKEERARAH